MNTRNGRSNRTLTFLAIFGLLATTCVVIVAVRGREGTVPLAWLGLAVAIGLIRGGPWSILLWVTVVPGAALGYSNELTILLVATILVLEMGRLRDPDAEAERRGLLRQIEAERSRLQAVLQQLPVGVAIVEAPTGRLLLHNDEAERLLRHPLIPATGPGKYPLFGAIHPDGRPFEADEYPSARVIDRGEAIKAMSVDYRHDDGAISHLAVNSAPIRDDQGTIVAAVTVFVDVTERKRAERERTEMLRRLVTLQEDERRRIARELHDQMGQHIAALTLRLKALEEPGDPTAPDRLEPLRQMVDELGREAHRIALELRPTALDDLGLHSALLNHAEEWSDRYRIDLDFQSRGLEDHRLDPNLESALYRIVQEALTNVVKHARAGRVAIVLEKGGDGLIAIVEDDGVGFEAEAVMATPTPGHRMGLLGMKERVALVGGTLQIESSPGQGTTILIRVPDAPTMAV